MVVGAPGLEPGHLLRPRQAGSAVSLRPEKSKGPGILRSETRAFKNQSLGSRRSSLHGHAGIRENGARHILPRTLRCPFKAVMEYVFHRLV